jgi:hypothetical protein
VRRHLLACALLRGPHSWAGLAKCMAKRGKLAFCSFTRPNRSTEPRLAAASPVKLFWDTVWHSFPQNSFLSCGMLDCNMASGHVHNAYIYIYMYAEQLQYSLRISLITFYHGITRRFLFLSLPLITPRASTQSAAPLPPSARRRQSTPPSTPPRSSSSTSRSSCPWFWIAPLTTTTGGAPCS